MNCKKLFQGQNLPLISEKISHCRIILEVYLLWLNCDKKTLIIKICVDLLYRVLQPATNPLRLSLSAASFSSFWRYSSILPSASCAYETQEICFHFSLFSLEVHIKFSASQKGVLLILCPLGSQTKKSYLATKTDNSFLYKTLFSALQFFATLSSD